MSICQTGLVNEKTRHIQLQGLGMACFSVYLGLSQILCKHRNAVQIEQNLFKAEVAQAAAALFSK